MGHYDDCYAADDFKNMSAREKRKHYAGFKADLKKNGQIWGTFDDVYGHILFEWAKEHNYKIKRTNRSMIVMNEKEKGDAAKRS